MGLVAGSGGCGNGGRSGSCGGCGGLCVQNNPKIFHIEMIDRWNLNIRDVLMLLHTIANTIHTWLGLPNT